MKAKTVKSLSEKVGQASSLTVHGASVPRLPGGRMPPEPADRMSAPHSPTGSQRGAIGNATGSGSRERGPARSGTGSTSAPQDASSLAGAVVARTVKRAKARAPVLAQLWQLRLYVMGQTPKSVTAFANLKQFCESYLKGRYRITVIDLVKQPQLARGDQILAIPTVVRRLPKPVRTLIGTFSDTARVLVGLDLRAAE